MAVEEPLTISNMPTAHFHFEPSFKLALMVIVSLANSLQVNAEPLLLAQVTAQQQASLRHKSAGKAALQQQDIARALLEFRLYNQDQSSDPEGLFFLGYCLTHSGSQQEALNDYDMAEKQEVGYDLDSAELRTNRGNLLLQSSRAGEAESEFRRALAIDPLAWDARLNLAQLLLLQEQVDAACTQLNECASTRGEDPRYCYLQGIASIKKGLYQSAVDWLRKCQVTSNQSGALSSSDNQMIIEAGKLLQMLKARGQAIGN